MFPELSVQNLSSRYEGWLEEIFAILKELDLTNTISNTGLGVPSRALKDRLKELKYICLVSDLSKNYQKSHISNSEHKLFCVNG